MVNKQHSMLGFLLNVLEFEAEINRYSGDARGGEGLSNTNLETLIDIVLHHI